MDNTNCSVREIARKVFSELDLLLLPTTGTTYRMNILAEPVNSNSNLGYYHQFCELLDLAALALPPIFVLEQSAFWRHADCAGIFR